MPSTRPYIPRLSFIFDFDLTLATATWDAACGVLGLTQQEWHERFVAPLDGDWDPNQRKARALIDAGAAQGVALDRAFFDAVGAAVTPYPGVLEMPGRVREHVKTLDPAITCEFAILSSGFRELFENSQVCAMFDTIYSGAFDIREGRATGVKRTITHAEKALYLRAHAEGLAVSASNSPGTANSVVDEYDRHVLFDQMTYIGDGNSDLQAFGFLESMGGLTIAIEDGDQFDAIEEQDRAQRVEALAAADYLPGSHLLQGLFDAAQAGAGRIALRRG